jgi:Domain of unknown function (DUF4760)
VWSNEIAEPVRWLGETIGFWVQTSILAVSALAALWVIKASKTQEKRRSTVDLIVEQKRDRDLTEARRVILAMHEAGEKNLAKHLESESSVEYNAILLVLNAYEFVSSGIREGAFDEGTYKRLRYSNVRKDWDALCAFVFEFRRVKSGQTLFQDFQWLNERWRKSPLKADRLAA